MKKRTKIKLTAEPTVRPMLPTIRIKSIACDAEQEEVPDYHTGHTATIITFAPDVVLETEPKMDMRAVGSVTINGFTFRKPITPL